MIKPKIKLKRKSGVTLWEIALFTVFLAIAGGASVFFFFLNSSEVRYAQKKYEWIVKTNKLLDSVVLEIANSLKLEHPFAGNSRDCFFKSPINAGDLGPSVRDEGFSFTDRGLIYVARGPEGETETLKRLGALSNPIIPDCKEGEFVRNGPDSLEINFKIDEPQESGKVKAFKRTIFLRNQ